MAKAAARHRRAPHGPTPIGFWRREDAAVRKFARDLAHAPYSHSIVAGGFDEMSYTTRLMPRTSLMTRLETRPRRS